MTGKSLLCAPVIPCRKGSFSKWCQKSPFVVVNCDKSSTASLPNSSMTQLFLPLTLIYLHSSCLTRPTLENMLSRTVQTFLYTIFNMCQSWMGLQKRESCKIWIDIISYLVKSKTVFDFPLWSGWQSTFLGLFIGPA